jgi:diguanylate cyclase (GGDEF)-like protein
VGSRDGSIGSRCQAWPAARLGGARRAAALAALALALAAAPGPAAVQALAAPPMGDAAVSFIPVQVPDEIPAHLCTALAQDRAGFLWIGTQRGLVRYDGYQFRVFRADPADPADQRSLGGSYVRSLLATADGRLWVGTFSSGLSVYDPATEAFTRYVHDPRRPDSLAHDRVEGLAEDGAGRLWIATYEGLDRLDPASGRIVHFRHARGDPRSLADDRVRGLLIDGAGRLWVGGADGLQIWRGEGAGFERIASDRGVPGSLAGQFVSKLAADGRGRIWIGTIDNGAAVLDPRDGSLRRLAPLSAATAGTAGTGTAVGTGLSHPWVYGFAEVAPGEMWIATFGGGIDVVDPASLAVVARLRHDPTLDSTIGSDRVGALLRDRSGVVWVGSWGHGLARHDPAARAFQALRFTPNRPDGLTHPEVVRALELRDGTLWVGTNGNGVDVLDRAGRRIAGLRPDPADPAALADGAVTCLAQGADGAVWVATLNGMLHRRRPGVRGFDRLTPAGGLPGGPIRTLVFGPDGALWAGAAAGLARIDPRTLAVRTWRHRAGDAASLSGVAVEALAFDRRGTLWVGTESGLNAFDPARGTARQILFAPGRRDGLPAGWVPDLMVARDGRLWIATPAGACILTSWDGRHARFTAVAPLLGRAPEPVEALIEDDRGFIWLGPRLRVDPRRWTAQDFGPAEGCVYHDFFIASRARTADGRLLFGSPEGLLEVRPERIAPWTFAPPLVITGLRVDGSERRGGSVLRRLRLAPGTRGFRLEFAALDLTAPERNAYRYRLVGYDDRWLPANAGVPAVAYNSLPPGDYLLRIEGTNRAGRWSSSEIGLPVTVLPAFYQTTAFRAAVVLALAALAYGGYRLRVGRLEARGRELERQVQERTVALSEKNDELAAAYRRIEEASLTDPLTRLRNRRFLDQSLGGDLELSARRHEDGGPAAAESALIFLLLDLDHFKSVNDTHGHAAGDAVLVQTARLLAAACRASDHVVRWGGEECLVVARFCDRRSAPDLAEKIRAAIEGHPFRLDDGAGTILRRTASIGFAAYPFAPRLPRAAGWQEIVALADLGLYAAKRSGRNRWVGVEVGETGDPAAALRRFLDNPGAAVASREILVQAPAGMADGLRWA